MQRRQFFKLAASASATYMVLQLTGCGSADEGVARVSIADGDSVVMYDINMEGWSTLGSGFLGGTGVLAATKIQDAKEITLDYEQDPHGHKFTLTREHFLKLRRGEKISVFTSEAQGHYHEVRIDPKNQVQGSQGVTMPVNPDAAGEDATGGEKMYAALEAKDPSKLYVAGSAEMDESSMEYCADTKERCAGDAGLWKAMRRHAARADKQIFASDDVLSFAVGSKEQPVSVRGKRKVDSKVLTFLMKLVSPT